MPTGGHFLPQLRAATPIIACNAFRVSLFVPVVKREFCREAKKDLAGSSVLGGPKTEGAATASHGRARGPCPTKLLCITSGGQSHPPLQNNIPVGRDPCVPPPTIHCAPCKKRCHCEPVRTLVWQSVIPLRPPMPTAAPFLSAAKEREERTPPPTELYREAVCLGRPPN